MQSLNRSIISGPAVVQRKAEVISPQRATPWSRSEAFSLPTIFQMKHHAPITSLLSASSCLLLAVLLVLLLGGCTSVELLNATIPKGGYLRTDDIAYGKLSRQMLDVYRPRVEQGVDRTTLPVIVFFYGGDWQFGSKTDYQFAAQALTSRGFVVVLPDYRLYPQVVFPAFVEDGALAVRWAHDHAKEFGGDPERLFVMGHSSGAYIAALLAMDKRYLQAVDLDRRVIKAAALLSGPYGFVPTGIRRKIFSMKPGQSLPDKDSQPLKFVDGNQPPLLLIQGMRDQTVNPLNTIRLTARIQERGGDVTTIYEKNRGHVGIVLSLARGFRWLAPTLDEVAAFFHHQEYAPHHHQEYAPHQINSVFCPRG